MPELPEVTTTVNSLQKVLPGLIFVDVWTDLAKKNQKIKQFKETIKDYGFYKKFRKKIIGQKVLNVERRAKNILINISGGNTILIHLKMTGHLLFGEYTKEIIKNEKSASVQDGLIINNWKPKNAGPLNDPYNRFIHVVFTFSNPHRGEAGVKHLAFCDSRKFGKITIIPSSQLDNVTHLKNIGPEPLENSFTFKEFEKRLFLKPNKKIKTILMDQSIVAGIGNIYSDEMLWSSCIHPESSPKRIPRESLSKLYKEMKKVLIKGIDFGGDSMSDYRNIDGERGKFQNHHHVYQKKNTNCVKKGVGVL